MPQDLHAFMNAYHCAVYNRLVQIDTRPETDRNRFLILDTGIGQEYTQVWLDEDHHNLLIEASSFFYEFEDPSMRRYPSAEACAALAKLGFDIEGGQTENYRIKRTRTPPHDLWDIAGLLLESLFRGYGAKIGQVRVNAPYAEGDHDVLLPVGEACRIEPPTQ